VEFFSSGVPTFIIVKAESTADAHVTDRTKKKKNVLGAIVLKLPFKHDFACHLFNLRPIYVIEGGEFFLFFYFLIYPPPNANQPKNKRI